MLKNITMEGSRFKLNLNLQSLSMISIAAKLWDSQDIKHRIENNFSGLNRYYPDDNWCDISKVVVQYANSINLPARLSVQLKKIILLIGQKIYDWIFYVTKILELDLVFTQKIYFSLGLVDEKKIFDLYWRDLMARDNFVYKSRYFKHSPLLSLACIYGCEKFVTERKNELLDELSELYPQIKDGDEIYNIMSVSICLTAKESIPENLASPQRMFELCLKAGFSKAARYFWGKLDEVEKFSNLTNFAKKCCGKSYDANFLRDKDCETLLFLMNRMGEEERSLFFTDYADEIIRLFLPICPYRELIVDLLKYDWNIESYKLARILDIVVRFSGVMNHLEFPLDNEFVFQIIQKAWENIPVNKKLSILIGRYPLIPALFCTFSPEILHLLINDPSITDVDRKEMYSFINDGFTELIQIGKFDFLNSIIEKIFNFIPEPKKFSKEYFSNHFFVCKLINNDESFGFLDQFLDWASETEAERARLKNEINTFSVCRHLTEQYKKFELADEFLKWRLETAAEIKTFKDQMKSYNFVVVEKSGLIRIKCGDLSWLRPGDSLVMVPDEDLYDNADGLTFLKFEEATEFNRGVVLGQSFCSGANDYFLVLGGLHARRNRVDFVGTKVGDFIVFNVCRIWNFMGRLYYNIHDAVKLSNAFIKFYYETEEEVLKFKKTKMHVLVTENLLKFLLDALEWTSNVPENFLDGFYEFCMIPSEKIEGIKIQQRSDLENFLDTYLIDQHKFLFAENYVKCLFGKVKGTEVSKKFLNSSNKATLLCLSYLKKRHEIGLQANADLDICRWLSLVDDMEKLKNDVFALIENTPEWFHTLLDKAAHSDVNSIC